jgi:hypothetical protein
MNMSNPDTLVKEIRSRFDHATQKKLLKEKYASKMVFAHAGGMWRAGPELMATLHLCDEWLPAIVLLDLYDTPVKVVPRELFDKASQIWQEQMNAWLVEHEELARQR